MINPITALLIGVWIGYFIYTRKGGNNEQQ